MLILDDDIIKSVRQKAIKAGDVKEDVKASRLLRTLLKSAREGKLTRRVGGSIAKCMERDISSGLDDPFDDRATSSFEDMEKWEDKWHTFPNESSCKDDGLPLPLVIFLRTESSQALFKSKSAIDALLQECNSEESVNLVVLGSGIDPGTLALLGNNAHDGYSQGRQDEPGSNGAPWFGFSQPNQNASGENDPEGSRRFNIYLVRTTDSRGAPGILGAIAPPQAGNMFPLMMAMQAKEKLQHPQVDPAARAELERWSRSLIEQVHKSNRNNHGNYVPAPQFFNASLASPNSEGANGKPLPRDAIQHTLEHALSELLDRLAEMSDDQIDSSSPDPSTDLHRAFAEVLRNENIRRGIADNLAKAAPALSDPKCQGVMLSVYVPPPGGPPPGGNGKPHPLMKAKPQQNVGQWIQKIIHNQDAADAPANAGGDTDEGRRKKQKRARAMAAYAMAANNPGDKQGDGSNADSKEFRNREKLEALCRSIPISAPTDPVRGKSWEGWLARERGAYVFRRNRKAMNEELRRHNLSLQQRTGTRGAGSSLRQMLSVRDITEEMDEVIRAAVELEAAKSQRLREKPIEMEHGETNLAVDVTLGQLLLEKEGGAMGDIGSASFVRHLHPSSLETALSISCRVQPSPSGGLSVNSSPASHRTRDEIAALAQDKHERALVSQVVSPQDIGVTYDMIGGLTEVKELLRQSITYPLKFPHLYSEGIAREAVKGVLLFGPPGKINIGGVISYNERGETKAHFMIPGTGKTMLAKAVATEGGASFLSVDASSVENKWLGESEKNAKAVFTLARRLSPCVIFIDEVCFQKFCLQNSFSFF
jgi:ATPase family associated with various cellular activities (AAA)